MFIYDCGKIRIVVARKYTTISEDFVRNFYKTLKQATGTMIPLVYVGSCNSDLIGFTYKMKKIKAEVDTT